MDSAGAGSSIFNVGDAAEAWSNSFGVWGKGKIIRVDPNGKVAVNFTLPDGQLYTKEFPAGHSDVRKMQTTPEPVISNPVAEQQAPAKATPPAAGRVWSIGDSAKVWSRTKQTWGHGYVEGIQGDMIMVRFELPEADGRMGGYSKGLHRDNDDLQPGDSTTPAAAAPGVASAITTPKHIAGIKHGTTRMEIPMAVPTPMQGVLGISGINSPGLPIGARRSALSGTSGIIVDELQVSAPTFDPTQPPLRSQLLNKLGLGQNAIVQFLPNCGGLNAGLWAVQDADRGQNLVLKLVKAQRIGPATPTETERLIKLAQEYPGLLNDPTVAFPMRIFQCVGMPGNAPHDLFVMRRAPGQRLTDVIPEKLAFSRGAEVMQILTQLGSFLAEFHARYDNKQHNDFQPANIMFDEAGGRFTMVDVADIGNPQSTGADVDHFVGSLQVLSTSYGQQFLVDSTNSFRSGYGMGRTSKNVADVPRTPPVASRAQPITMFFPGR